MITFRPKPETAQPQAARLPSIGTPTTDFEGHQMLSTPLLQARRAALMVATLGTGVVAGIFLVYAQAIMPGLEAIDDRSFVAAFQEIDRAIDRPWVPGTIVLSVILTAGVALLDRRRPVIWWMMAAVLFQLTTMAVTGTVHLPLNDAIKAAGDPQTIDVAQVRADFGEGRWQAWNLVRCVASTSAFICLVRSLVSYERVAGSKA